ncbi:hypothetical protein GGI07_003725 [Coemansia sp. Benny D115]|nr:hypothetical protein GGI07_003725 [Coemansia sp. Benny D115]
MAPLSPNTADYVQSAKAGIESVAHIDDLVREYLLFRGFKGTLAAFEEDLARDQDRGFNAERIVDDLLGLAKDLRADELLEYWEYLTFRFFSHLSPKYQRTIRMFEKRLIRLFLVSAVGAGKRQCIRSFMDAHGAVLGQQGGDWIPWLGLEYVENPGARPEFEAYFSTDWCASLKTALVDFVETVFPAMAVPRILLFDKERREREALQRRIDIYESRLSGETRIKAAVDGAGGAGLVENHIGGVDAAKGPAVRAVDSGDVPDSAASGGAQTLGVARADDVARTDDVASLLKISHEDIFLEHNSGVSLAKFSATGDLIASYDDEAILKVWSPDALSTAPRLKNELDYTVSAMAWDRKHAHLLYLYSEHGYVHTLNTNTKLASRQCVFEKKHPWIQAMLASEASSTLLMLCSAKPESTSDALLQLWDANAGRTVASKRLSSAAESQGVSVALNHNANLAVLAYNTGHVRLLDTRSMETVEKITTRQKDLCAIEFSLEEDALVAVTEDGRLTQWSLRKSSQLLAESSLAIGAAADRDRDGGRATALTADFRLDCDRVAFTPDRENVVVAPRDQCLVFNVDSAALTDATRRHKDLVSCIDFAADRSLSASEDGTIRVAHYRRV